MLWSRRRGRHDDRFGDDEDIFDRAMYPPVEPGDGEEQRRYPEAYDEPAPDRGYRDAPPEPADPFAPQDDPDSVDTAPTRIETPQRDDEAQAQSALEEPSLPAPVVGAFTESSAPQAPTPESAGAQAQEPEPTEPEPLSRSL